MRFEKRNFVRWLFTVFLIAMVTVSFQIALAGSGEKSLDTARKLTGNAGKRAGGYKTMLETSQGLHIAALYTAHGNIKVYFPGDITAGEKISGVVYPNPLGRTQKEKKKNLDVLNGFFVEIKEIKDEQIPATKKRRSFTIPKDLMAIHLVFKDKKGIQVGKTEVPLYPEPPFSRDADFKLPSIGQAGSFLDIPGPFDGDFSGTKVRIGDSDAELLAESPRGLVVFTPGKVLGPTKITLKEGGIEASGEFRSVSVTPRVDKWRLHPGETTTLTVTVKGLDSLKDEVPFRLQNKTPGIISMQGGSIRTLIIRAKDIKPGGIYILTRTLTGKVMGDYRIKATIYPRLKQCAERLGSNTGMEYRKELTDLQKEEILNMPESHFITFMKKDLYTYKTGKEPSVTPGLKECAGELTDFLNTAKPEDHQWLADIYLKSVFNALRGVPQLKKLKVDDHTSHRVEKKVLFGYLRSFSPFDKNIDVSVLVSPAGTEHSVRIQVQIPGSDKSNFIEADKKGEVTGIGGTFFDIWTAKIGPFERQVRYAELTPIVRFIQEEKEITGDKMRIKITEFWPWAENEVALDLPVYEKVKINFPDSNPIFRRIKNVTRIGGASAGGVSKYGGVWDFDRPGDQNLTKHQLNLIKNGNSSFECTQGEPDQQDWTFTNMANSSEDANVNIHDISGLPFVPQGSIGGAVTFLSGREKSFGKVDIAVLPVIDFHKLDITFNPDKYNLILKFKCFSNLSPTSKSYMFYRVRYSTIGSVWNDWSTSSLYNIPGDKHDFGLRITGNIPSNLSGLQLALGVATEEAEEDDETVEETPEVVVDDVEVDVESESEDEVQFKPIPDVSQRGEGVSCAAAAFANCLSYWDGSTNEEGERPYDNIVDNNDDNKPDNKELAKDLQEEMDEYNRNQGNPGGGGNDVGATTHLRNTGTYYDREANTDGLVHRAVSKGGGRPLFEYMKRHFEACHDVILRIVWRTADGTELDGAHFLTVAGIDERNNKIFVSNGWGAPNDNGVYDAMDYEVDDNGNIIIKDDNLVNNAAAVDDPNTQVTEQSTGDLGAAHCDVMGINVIAPRGSYNEVNNSFND